MTVKTSKIEFRYSFDTSSCIIIRDRIEGGGVIEVWVIEQSGFLKNGALNKFRKIAYIKWFFRRFSSSYA